jgi:hypothetical protein
MPDFTQATDSKLVRLYRGPQKMVAFLDESYDSQTASAGRFFYAMTAVVLSSGDLDSVRWAYAQWAGNTNWHTTERFQQGRGAGEIMQFVNCLAMEADPLLIVLQADRSLAHTNLEQARRTCFVKLVEILNEEHDVTLIVYERRRPGYEQNNDEGTAKILRRTITGLSVVDAWSGSEPLLWGPDVLAWTLQRRLRAKEAWFDPFIGVAKIYTHDGTRVTNMGKIGP